MRKILLATICIAIIANISCKKGKTTTTTQSTNNPPVVTKDYSLVGKYVFIDTIISEYTNPNTGEKTYTDIVQIDTTILRLCSIQTDTNSRNVIVNSVKNNPSLLNAANCYDSLKKSLIFYNNGNIVAGCIGWISPFYNSYFDTTTGKIIMNFNQDDPLSTQYWYHRIKMQKIY